MATITIRQQRFRLTACLFGCGLMNALAVYLIYQWQYADQPSSVHSSTEFASSLEELPDPIVVRDVDSNRGTEPPLPTKLSVLRDQPNPFRLVSNPKNSSWSFRENFDQKSTAYPNGWSSWQRGGRSKVSVLPAKALSAPNCLALTADSKVTIRTWLVKTLPADVRAEVAVFLDSLIPAHLFIRGSNLNGPSPGYYGVVVTRGLEVQLIRVNQGTPKVLASLKSTSWVSGKWVRVTLQASGGNLKVRVFRTDTAQFLGDAGQWEAQPTWAIDRTDSAIASGGQIGLGRFARYNGTVCFDDLVITPPQMDAAGGAVTKTSGPGNVKVPSLTRPQFPRHYSHIRIAMLAYAGNPMGPYERALLKNSVDLVIPNVAYLRTIKSVAPKTPQLVYTNTSNLYLDLLTDWLNFADAKGYSREDAFYHAARPQRFRGNSPSSMPVTWFWGVYQGTRRLANLTNAAHSKSSRIDFGFGGESLYLGYHDRFREINLELVSGARNGWKAVVDYVQAVDRQGHPTRWGTITTRTDTTNGFSRSGQITFDPPSDWKPASVAGSAGLHYIRVRSLNRGKGPVARTILGRDYVDARGTNSGMVPAFDFTADRNKDGYLDDSEYARRESGKNARFVYESRMLTESYGQMRFSTNPTNLHFRDWAKDYHVRMMKKIPLANGLFMDNCDGKPPVVSGTVLESVATYAYDYGAMLNAVSRAIGKHWVLANTNDHVRSDPVVKFNTTYMIEFAIRPLSHNYVYFEDLAAAVHRRTQLASPPPLAVIDSHPQRGTVTDPRLQLATLAYYYLIHDPQSTFLMFFGGFEPNTTWRRHWVPAAGVDIGQPRGKWSLWDTGKDPGNSQLVYKVFQRQFGKAIVLYKPLSYVRGFRGTSSNGNDTATAHPLKGSYFPLQANGTLGKPITTVSLRNGEGAILLREK